MSLKLRTMIIKLPKIFDFAIRIRSWKDNYENKH